MLPGLDLRDRGQRNIYISGWRRLDYVNQSINQWGQWSCRTLSSRWRKLCPPIGASFRSSRDSVCAMRGFKWTHASERGAAARKVEWAPALREFENFVGSRFTPACNTSTQYTTCGRKGWSPMYVYVHLRLSHGVSFIMADQGLLWAVKQTKM